MCWLFKLVVNLSGSLIYELNKIIDMCFYVKHESWLTPSTGKTFVQLYVGLSLPSCVSAFSLFFPLPVSGDNTRSQYCHLWSQDLILTVYLVPHTVLWQAVRHLMCCVRCGGQDAVLEFSWICGFKGWGTSSSGFRIAWIHHHLLHPQPYFHTTYYIHFLSLHN